MLRLRLLTLTLASLPVAACASLHEEPSKTGDISADTEADFKPVPFTTATGLVDYQAGSTKEKGQWVSCRGKKATTATVLLMHSDRQAYEPARFCQGWHAQAFLSTGFDVITVNRPGFGTSTGTPDFTGAASVAEVLAVAPAAVSAAKLPHPVTGVWGYGSGATAAAIVAKQLKGLKFAVLGGGIYDYEETLRNTSDKATKGDIETIKKLGGDKAIEERSVGYDPTGLPGVVDVYQGANDKVAPVAQAKSFVDSLTSSGQSKVSYQVLEGQGHDIPWVYHRHVLEALIKDLGPAAH